MTRLAERRGPAGLLARSRAIARHPAVLIVGLPRSGTSILYRALLEQPSFRIGQMGLTETRAPARLRRLDQLSDEGLAQLRVFQFWDQSAWDAVTADARLLGIPRAIDRLATRRGWRGTGDPPSSKWWWATGQGLLLRSYLATSWEARGAQRLLEKSPYNILWLPHLSRALPRARFIVIHRHPTEALNSYRHRKELASTRWQRWETLDDFVGLWRQLSETLLRARDDTRVLTVSYDNLVADPTGTMREVCRSIGEEFDPTAMPGDDKSTRAWVADNERLRPETRRLWLEGGDRTFEAIGRRPEQSQRASLVSAEEAAVIEERLHDVLAPLGYASTIR